MIDRGGFLPACADSIARYLADHAGLLSVNTLRSRLAALAKTPHVRKILKGIAALHPATETRGKPLQLAQLERLTAWLGEQIADAMAMGHARGNITHVRNTARVLPGLWRGFRADELSRCESDTSP